MRKCIAFASNLAYLNRHMATLLAPVVALGLSPDLSEWCVA